MSDHARSPPDHFELFGAELQGLRVAVESANIAVDITSSPTGSLHV
jgi:hypothetical protein